MAIEIKNNFELRWEGDLGMKDTEFLGWIYERMKNVHNEDPNIDYMIKLKKVIKSIEYKDAVLKSSLENWDNVR